MSEGEIEGHRIIDVENRVCIGEPPYELAELGCIPRCWICYLTEADYYADMLLHMDSKAMFDAEINGEL